MKKKNSRAGKTVKSAENISAFKPAPNEELTSTTKPAPMAQANGPIHIPPILLEGDESASPPEPPQTQKYTIGPTRIADRFEPESRELPEAYGTGKLLLTARDPHWLYAHWDLSREQQRAYNARSAEGHLVVRVHSQEPGAATEVPLHPESRHWFVQVPRADSSYSAELGYYQPTNEWVSISTSTEARTPPDQVSEDETVQFATRGPGDQQNQSGGIIPPQVEWLPALQPKGEDAVSVPAQFAGTALALEETASFRVTRTECDWNETQPAALSEITSMQSVPRRWVSSFEISESIRRDIEREIASIQFGEQWPREANFVSSPLGEPPQVKAFWFNVNAELIIYGATQPDATVTVGGKPIQLRPDGTFSFRLALPDGAFEVEVAARSVENDSRRAELQFTRHSTYDEAMKNPE